MHVFQICGAGGIGKAAAQIILAAISDEVRVIVGDRSQHALSALSDFVGHDPRLQTYVLDFDNKEAIDLQFAQSDVVLDCLPGSLAPKVAAQCLAHHCHYANLTEYVAETAEIRAMAANAQTGFVLQTGLAPGYINVLACQLFRQFCLRYAVSTADSISMKVGALTRNAVAPHFYGFTWSPIGVATEYVKDAVILRNGQVQRIQALSQIESVLINGEWYEDNFTSGGAADLPESFKDKVKNLDYRTLRHPGHYDWVRSIMNQAPSTEERISYLEKTMLSEIPSYEEDMVMVYVRVQGRDQRGYLRAIDKSLKIEPTFFGQRLLTAIQATTAAPLIQSALMLLSQQHKGVILQSQIDPDAFLSGEIVKRVYG